MGTVWWIFSDKSQNDKKTDPEQNNSKDSIIKAIKDPEQNNSKDSIIKAINNNRLPEFIVMNSQLTFNQEDLSQILQAIDNCDKDEKERNEMKSLFSKVYLNTNDLHNNDLIYQGENNNTTQQNQVECKLAFLANLIQRQEYKKLKAVLEHPNVTITTPEANFLIQLLPKLENDPLIFSLILGQQLGNNPINVFHNNNSMDLRDNNTLQSDRRSDEEESTIPQYPVSTMNYYQAFQNSSVSTDRGRNNVQSTTTPAVFNDVGNIDISHQANSVVNRQDIAAGTAGLRQIIN